MPALKMCSGELEACWSARAQVRPEIEVKIGCEEFSLVVTFLIPILHSKWERVCPAASRNPSRGGAGSHGRSWSCCPTARAEPSSLQGDALGGPVLPSAPSPWPNS